MVSDTFASQMTNLRVDPILRATKIRAVWGCFDFYRRVDQQDDFEKRIVGRAWANDGVAGTSGCLLPVATGICRHDDRLGCRLEHHGNAQWRDRDAETV